MSQALSMSFSENFLIVSEPPIAVRVSDTDLNTLLAGKVMESMRVL